MTPQHEGAEAAPHATQPDLGFELPPATAISSRRLTVLAALVVLGLLAAFAVGYLPRRQARAALVEEVAGRSTTPKVAVVTPKLGASTRALELPGSVEPLQETVLYARASGFVRRWLVDLGDHVKEGQVLAEIDTPELDQELAQAKAQLAQAQAQLVQAQANQALAGANLARYRELAPSGVVSRADVDENEAKAKVGDANVLVAQANVAAQQANIRRLNQLQGFSKVTAPFAGVITQRTAEVGALVTAGNGQPLFKVAATNPARVFVQVPQDVAPSVRAGVAVQVKVREYPRRTFTGVISRASGELDRATRTLMTEVRVPNDDGALIPGMYAEAELSLPASHRVLEIPATALMNDATGPHVATVGSDGKVHLAPVVVERDDGPVIHVASGLNADDRVVKLGSVALLEGAAVEVVGPSEPAAAR